jgi:DNA-binding transcriptional ArsR family regulator
MIPQRKATNEPATVDDAVWLALNDGSRRRILDLLRKRPMTTGELCEYFEFSRFAVMKHLKVLVDAALVLVERQGRERINHLNPLPLQAIYRRWIKPFEKLPADRMLRIKALVERRNEE